jgi:hypothetical protein
VPNSEPKNRDRQHSCFGGALWITGATGIGVTTAGGHEADGATVADVVAVAGTGTELAEYAATGATTAGKLLWYRTAAVIGAVFGYRLPVP